MEHTPAPWEVKYGAASEIHIESSRGTIVVCDGLFGKQEDIEANARLIAAAPELLEALKMMVKMVCRTELEYLSEVNAACVAINKAEGK